MAKKRYKLMPLRDLDNGTRFYTTKRHRPFTLVTNSKRRGTLVHHGHDFNLSARKDWIPDYYRVWVEVSPPTAALDFTALELKMLTYVATNAKAAVEMVMSVSPTGRNRRSQEAWEAVLNNLQNAQKTLK